jgi:uncharacterized protein YsxB (DUF464 family)
LITVKVTKNSIKTTGHADYNEHGKDIICASVSILMQTLELRCITSLKDNGFMIVYTDDKQALELIAEGLKLIANNYPQYVEVIK